MRLSAWVAEHGVGAISLLARRSGLAYTTVHAAVHGQPLKLYEVAKKLSDATREPNERGEPGEPAVSIAELCEPEPKASSQKSKAAARRSA